MASVWPLRTDVLGLIDDAIGALAELTKTVIASQRVLCGIHF
jgi:hypothetical protein